MSNRIINPILPGFYPDPSICAGGGKYKGKIYIVNSSFSYFPGLPVFESSDCVKWKQIGNVIDRPDQLDFNGAGVSRGLFAPTIRYYDGLFYCICTQVDKLGNFFVTAENPAGPWSNPVPIPEAEGIDPSLFFDDDGKCYYVGTRPAPEGCKYSGNWEIYIGLLDLKTGHITGEKKGIWRGALKDCVWPEGPHIYKINGKYYLLHAEGGTGPDHAVCVARCDTIDGQWVGKKSNPILTHRHLGKSAGVVYVGHADLFQDNDKRWWLVCLASRPYGNGSERFCNMGRETFMVPVKWEDDWPVVCSETGKIENAYTITGHVVTRGIEDIGAVEMPTLDDFNEKNLDFYWLNLRKRDENFVNLDENSGSLRIYGGEALNSNGNVNMVVRRQTGFSYEASTNVKARFTNDEDCAGLVCFQCENFNYRLQLKKRGKVILVQLLKSDGNDKAHQNQLLAEEVINGGNDEVQYVLRVVAEKQSLRFEYGPDERCLNVLAENIDGSILSVEKAGGFVGTVIGMFAISGDDYSKKEFYADFDWFRYENTSLDWCDIK